MCSDGFIESICMNVTNGDGQSIGCIVRLRCLAEFQKRTNHLLNLHLFGTAVTGNSASAVYSQNAHTNLAADFTD